MKLYFLRHAEAEDGKDLDDHDRRLTTNGIERTSAAAKVMTKLDIVPLFIYSSPRVRARQTADIVAQHLGMGVDVREEVDFTFSLKAVEKLIAELKPEDDVMFVGHEPSFSATIGALTGASVEMKKGGLARVDVISTFPLRGVLVWLVAPKIFDVLTADETL
jgi:phosphohistidine phosphatase